MKPLRLAVIGAGHLGKIHARLIRSLPDAELVAVVDPSPDARRQAAQDLAVETLAHHADLYGRIDAAVVATPTFLHHGVALELLRRGVHLLVEKPLAATVQQADEMVAAAALEGLVLQVGHVERFNPALAAVAEQIVRPKYIDAVRASGYSFRSTDIGVVLDLMIHDLDVVLSLVGSQVVGVDALGISVLGGHEDLAQARLTFANGCVANLSASRVSYEPQRRMHVYSEQSFAAIDFATKKTKVVRASAAVLGRELDVNRLDAAEKTRLRENFFREVLPLEELAPEDRNAILDELHDFAGSIRQQRAPRVTGQQAREALLLAEMILARIAAHRWTGDRAGPVGPLAAPAAAILSGPHWPASAAVSPTELHRKAG